MPAAPPPPQRPARKRPYKPRRKGLHRRKHHLSPKGLAKLRAALKIRAAWRKAHGIRIHHKFHHRKPMTVAQHQHFVIAIRAAAARRKALGLRTHRHLSPLARSRLILRLRAMRHRPPVNPIVYRIKARGTVHRPTHVSRRKPTSRFRIKRVRMVSSNPTRRRRKPH